MLFQAMVNHFYLAVLMPAAQVKEGPHAEPLLECSSTAVYSTSGEPELSSSSSGLSLSAYVMTVPFAQAIVAL